MNHPDQLSREYAAILPALKDHGYRADVKASIADERFILVVSGKPTTRIYRDGGWVRDDGARGSTPADLLSLYKHEHYTEALKHWKNKDWRGIARDLLIDNGVRMGSVLSAVSRVLIWTWSIDRYPARWKPCVSTVCNGKRKTC